MEEKNDTNEIENIKSFSIQVSNFYMSEDVRKLIPDMIRAQKKITSAKINRENKFLKSKYADLNSVLDAVKPQLLENNILPMQMPSSTKLGHASCDTVFWHESGQFIGCSMDMKGEKVLSPQEVGKLLSYIRRYMITSMTVLPTEEDDGESGECRNTTKSGGGIIKPKQIESINTLFGLLNIPEEKINGRLKKYGVSSVEELTKSQADIIINRLNEQIDKKGD